MSKLEPEVEEVLLALVRGLKALEVPFCIVGALVPELLLDERPAEATLDADAVVFVRDLDTFERVKKELAGFVPDEKKAYRLHHVKGGRADILPYSEQLAPDGILKLEPDHHFNMAGYDRVANASTLVRLDTGDEMMVVTVPMYVLLKLVTYTDRHLDKDIKGVLHCLRHYATDGDRRYGLTHLDNAVPFEYGFAYLLGVDARLLLDDQMRAVIRPLLDKIAPLDFDEDDEAPYRERQDESYLRWFRAGLAV
jgi:predicted nucleotidyltransferase